MSDPLNFEKVRVQFKAYQKEIVRLLSNHQVVEHTPKAEDAGVLSPDYTYIDLLRPAQEMLAEHIADKNNPHRETATSIGTYTREELMEMLSHKVPSGTIPVTTFLHEFTRPDSTGYYVAVWQKNNTSLTLITTIEGVINGIPYSFSEYTIDFRQYVVPNYRYPPGATETYYTIIMLQEGKPILTTLPAGFAQLYMNTYGLVLQVRTTTVSMPSAIITNETPTGTVSLFQEMAFDGKILHQDSFRTRQGGGIPHSSNRGAGS